MFRYSLLHKKIIIYIFLKLPTICIDFSDMLLTSVNGENMEVVRQQSKGDRDSLKSQLTQKNSCKRHYN